MGFLRFSMKTSATQMLRWLILKGLEEITEADFEKLVKGKD